MNSGPSFSLKLLGNPSIQGHGGPLLTGRAAQRHRIALLALLARSPERGLSREKVMAYLWPENDPEHARNLLNVSVYVIRKALGEDALVTSADDLRLNLHTIKADVAEFEAAVMRADHEHAAALYEGPFLDGFFLSHAPEFERWAERERERLAASYAKTLEALAEAAEARRDFTTAAERWKERAAHDPYDSRVARCLIEALEADGNRAAALRHAELHERLLREEIGAEPDPQVTALAVRLRTVPLERSPAGRPGPVSTRRDLPASSAPDPIPIPSDKTRKRVPSIPLAVAGAGAMALAVLVAQPWLSDTTEEPEPSVAVLPFLNMSGDESDDYFGDGMTEELIHALANVEGLRVIARTSAFQYKEKGIDVREVGQRLGVASVLEGSVRRSGARLRITVQLVSTNDGTHLWSEAYDRELEDALTVQQEIARSIVNTLRPRLTDPTSLVARHSRDHEAYHLYLKGRHAVAQRTPAAVRQAIEYYAEAIVRDPHYALAYAGLADAHVRRYDIAGDPPGEVLPRARSAARRALELDSTLAEPHALLGWIYTDTWQWTEAETALERALQLDPNRPDTYLDYTLYLDNMGRFDEALQACLRARELDPLSPRVGYNIVGSYLHLAQFEPAVAEARAMIALHPNLPLGYDALGWALVDSGLPGEAIEPLERAVRLGEGRWLALANLGRAYAFVGRRSDAQAVLARLDQDWGHSGLGNFAMAAVHIALGERERALERLEQVYLLRHAKLPHVRQWTAFEPLYEDPEFIEIVREAGY